MRIKHHQFRAKPDKDTPYWRYGGIFIPNSRLREVVKGEVYIVGEDTYSYGNMFSVIPETVCEFSGLYDSIAFNELPDSEQIHFFNAGKSASEWEGHPLYEGDIVRGNNTFNGKQSCFVVIYEDNGFYLEDGDNSWHPEHIKDMVLIGNVFDNPELMPEYLKSSLAGMFQLPEVFDEEF